MKRKLANTPREHVFAGTELAKHWKELHEGDREPWPDERHIAAITRRESDFAKTVTASGGASEMAQQLQEAWRSFHSGDFPAAIKLGSELGALGATVANKAAAVQTLYSKQAAARILQTLEAARARGEKAVGELPNYPNAHYTLALVLGRYSQRISILKALSEGLAGQVRLHLERAIQLEPRHAEAHVAFGLYHAEIINKLGSLAAGLAYSVSANKALEHFKQALRLAPSSPIVHLEYAHGLLLLDASLYRTQAHSLFEGAAECAPRDAMEAQDVAYAKRDLAEARV